MISIQELKDRLQMRVECSDRCACNANHCTNRAVQVGFIEIASERKYLIYKSPFRMHSRNCRRDVRPQSSFFETCRKAGASELRPNTLRETILESTSEKWESMRPFFSEFIPEKYCSFLCTMSTISIDTEINTPKIEHCRCLRSHRAESLAATTSVFSCLCVVRQAVLDHCISAHTDAWVDEKKQRDIHVYETLTKITNVIEFSFFKCKR